MTVQSIREAVSAVIEHAAKATGVDFGYLLSTAKRESGFKADAKAPTSSAAGLFQFVDQTWLGALKRHGAKYGYAAYANMIQQTSDGKLQVAGRDTRRAVMDLRLDPRAASLMAGELASEHAAYLRGRTGREPTGGELYAAHFLGPKASAQLIEANQTRPGASAAALFPDAAAANRSIFYHEGRPASVGQVYANLTQAAPAPAVAAPPAAEGGYLHYASAERLGRLDQERQLTDLILGASGDDAGDRKSGSSLTSALFSSEMLRVLSEARGPDSKQG